MTDTKIQNFVFMAIMVFVMAYTITLYNIALSCGYFHLWMFRAAIVKMWIPYAFACVCEMFVAKPLAYKAVRAILPPNASAGIRIVSMALAMVSIMCPVMTLFVSVIFVGVGQQLPTMWLSLLLRNYPFVLCFQILVAGPLVRTIFETLFRTVAAPGK